MKLPNSVHISHPWRIHDIARDFELLDVWALRVQGAAEDFDCLINLVASSDPANADSVPARYLWRVRDRLGDRLALGRIAAPVEKSAGDLTIPGTHDNTLTVRLPRDLRTTAEEVRFATLPFVALYRTDFEFAAEISNRTMHGIMHLGWVEQGHGTFEAQMAVYVKTRGKLGQYYMKLIEPFRQFVVYPALMRQIARKWASQGTDRAA